MNLQLMPVQLHPIDQKKPPADRRLTVVVINQIVALDDEDLPQPSERKTPICLDRAVKMPEVDIAAQ